VGFGREDWIAGVWRRVGRGLMRALRCCILRRCSIREGGDIGRWVDSRIEVSHCSESVWLSIGCAGTGDEDQHRCCKSLLQSLSGAFECIRCADCHVKGNRSSVTAVQTDSATAIAAYIRTSSTITGPHPLTAAFIRLLRIFTVFCIEIPRLWCATQVRLHSKVTIPQYTNTAPPAQRS
jgi:hypothetical protein